MYIIYLQQISSFAQTKDKDCFKSVTINATILYKRFNFEKKSQESIFNTFFSTGNCFLPHKSHNYLISLRSVFF